MYFSKLPIRYGLLQKLDTEHYQPHCQLNTYSYLEFHYPAIIAVNLDIFSPAFCFQDIIVFLVEAPWGH